MIKPIKEIEDVTACRPATRQEIESQLAELRRMRGAALLDGTKFDTSAIEKAESDLAALDDAEGVRISRQREWEAQDARASYAHKVKRIGTLEGDRLLAWADLESASRALLAAVGRVISSTGSEQVLWNDVSSGGAPPALSPYETKHRIRGRVGEFLAAAKVGFEVPGAGGIYSSAPLEDWRQVEEKAMTQHINAIQETE